MFCAKELLILRLFKELVVINWFGWRDIKTLKIKNYADSVRNSFTGCSSLGFKINLRFFWILTTLLEYLPIYISLQEYKKWAGDIIKIHFTAPEGELAIALYKNVIKHFQLGLLFKPILFPSYLIIWHTKSNGQIPPLMCWQLAWAQTSTDSPGNNWGNYHSNRNAVRATTVFL